MLAHPHMRAGGCSTSDSSRSMVAGKVRRAGPGPCFPRLSREQKNRTHGCLEGDTFLVIYSHVVWCLGAFFQSILGSSGDGGRITATQGGLGSIQLGSRSSTSLCLIPPQTLLPLTSHFWSS